MRASTDPQDIDVGEAYGKRCPSEHICFHRYRDFIDCWRRLLTFVAALHAVFHHTSGRNLGYTNIASCVKSLIRLRLRRDYVVNGLHRCASAISETGGTHCVYCVYFLIFLIF